MPLGIDEAVPIIPSWSCWIDSHDLEVESCHNLHTGEGPSEMTALGLLDHEKNVSPDISALLLDVRLAHT
jgi:hypothetical protein